MTCRSVLYGSQDNDFLFPLPLNYRPVWAANDVPYDVISGVIAGSQKVYPHFSVMAHGLVHESCAHIFLAHGDPLSDWTTAAWRNLRPTYVHNTSRITSKIQITATWSTITLFPKFHFQNIRNYSTNKQTNKQRGWEINTSVNRT